MTVDPTSTRANRINSDSFDWSYIGISFGGVFDERVGHARGRSTADPAFAPTRWPQMALRRHGRVRLRGPRQCLRVDILPDVRELAISYGDGEDEMVLERPVRGCDLP